MPTPPLTFALIALLAGLGGGFAVGALILVGLRIGGWG